VTVSAPTTDTAARLLDELVAQRDIQRTMVAYAEAIDYGDNAAWAATFTPDGVFDVRRRGEPLFAHAGTQALLDFVATHTHAPDTYHKHLVGLPTIEVAGDRATARAYFTMLHESPAGPKVLVFGRYLDQLERGADGSWRFAERVVDMEDIGTR
jgi:ketosteroid isomerase-like protein